MKPMHHLYTLIWLRKREEQRNALNHTSKDNVIEKTKTKTNTSKNQTTQTKKPYTNEDIEKLLLII